MNRLSPIKMKGERFIKLRQSVCENLFDGKPNALMNFLTLFYCVLSVSVLNSASRAMLGCIIL